MQDCWRIDGSCDSRAFPLPKPTRCASNQRTRSAESCLWRARGLVVPSPDRGDDSQKASSDQVSKVVSHACNALCPNEDEICAGEILSTGVSKGIWTSWIDCPDLPAALSGRIRRNHRNPMEPASKQKRRASPLGS